MEKWSGDHSMASDILPGILLSSRKLVKPDPSLYDLLKPREDKTNNWVVSGISIEIRYEEGKDATILIRQAIADTTDGNILATKGPVAISFAEEKARKLILEMFNNIKAHETAGSTAQSNLPVIEGKDIREKFAQGQLNPGAVLSQKAGKLGNKYFYTKMISYARKNIQDLLRYIRECLSSLSGGGAALQAGDIFAFLLLGSSFT
jgi:hypothetical protein